MHDFANKVMTKLRKKKVRFFYHTRIYKYMYLSYWHAVLFNRGKASEQKNMYFAAVPNRGAGIGHQMANWIAGYWFAERFNLGFAHIPFASDKWEQFLGFYKDEVLFSDLRRDGYMVRRIPLFDENNENEVRCIKKIIDSYQGNNVILLAEQDQFYHDQYGVMEEIQKKFYSAPARKQDKLVYSENVFNVAIHVRRGDIVQSSGENNPNLAMRYQSNDYFVNALNTALKYFAEKKDIEIYLFSQGKEEDYPEFKKYSNIHFCLDMGAQESFLHMVYADALITSKSSFSYKPALLNKGIKFCPADFWHGYPKTEDWILLDENGKIK